MRLISVLLIGSLIYSIMACYSTKQIHQHEEITIALYRGEELKIYTKDSVYKLKSSSYIVRKDTLYGVLQDSKFGYDAKSIKIGLSDISYIEKTNYDADKTTILLGAGVLMVLVIGGFYLAVSSLNFGFQGSR